MSKAKLTRRSNGYFELWTRPCGHTVRVNSEGYTSRLKDKVTMTHIHKLTAERLATSPCQQCRGTS